MGKASKGTVRKAMVKQSSKVLIRKPEYPAGRRVFRFRTLGAEIRFITYRGKRRIIRIVHNNSENKAFARKDFLKHKIFHTLFPKNSIAPVGVASVKEQGKTHYGMVSAILRNRGIGYKVFQQYFYGGLEVNKSKKTNAPQPGLATLNRHKMFISQVAEPFALKIKKETGIKLNINSVNVCGVKFEPVFFEIVSINEVMLKKYIKDTVKTEKKRAQLLKYLNELSYYRIYNAKE